jgi:hypothetical protein
MTMRGQEEAHDHRLQECLAGALTVAYWHPARLLPVGVGPRPWFACLVRIAVASLFAEIWLGRAEEEWR